jgi:hypothetical protein
MNTPPCQPPPQHHALAGVVTADPARAAQATAASATTRTSRGGRASRESREGKLMVIIGDTPCRNSESKLHTTLYDAVSRTAK